jgi:DNA-directed RNA polymerase specialized sigma24 family protein
MTRNSHHCSGPAASRRRLPGVITTHPVPPNRGGRVSTPSHRPHTALSPVDAYVTAVHQAIIRLIVRFHGADAPQDVAQDVVETLLGKVQRVMSRYPNPQVYARVAYRHACIQTARTNRVQRGEGSRLYLRADGTRAPGHHVVSGDAVEGADDRSLFDTITSGGDAFDEVIITRIDAHRQISQAWNSTSRRDRTAYFMVRGLGYPVTEVAESLGVRRETLQRRLARLDSRTPAGIA